MGGKPVNVHSRRAAITIFAIAVCAAFFIIEPRFEERESMVFAENPNAQLPHIPGEDEIKQLPPDGGPKYNRLVFEQSPYLLQHAANPVDWYPWGEEAFEKARREDKPVFLSIGYSTCHWCHVMEHESFEDKEVAQLMNQWFVPIKVDREERPDLDQIYMTVTQAMTGQGGWPMTVILTPEKTPFFAGTYFPKDGRMGRPGMMDLLPAVHEAWTGDREKIDQSAARVMDLLQNASAGAAGEVPGVDILEKAFRELSRQYDDRRGGFGVRPKFPTPHRLSYLLRYWKRSQNAEALEIVVKTLSEMRRGGIFDHVGFGFHRYSTDAEWLLPHFEKMLYDQALLAIAYIEAYQATGEEAFARTAREIFTYVLRDMTSPEGGFYSAEDADSEGEEGKFYVWTTEEIRTILPAEDAKLFIEVFNLEEGGNFREEATGEATGGNIPHLRKEYDIHAKILNVEPDELRGRIERIRRTLFEVREKRIHPLKDDKILTDWNGLMIAALAIGGRSLGVEEYVRAAETAANFAWDRLRDGEGRLLKRYRNGTAGLPAHLEDYAFMTWGLLELYEANFGIEHLKRALALNQTMIESFEDRGNGGFYLTAEDAEKLIVRPKEIYDGAIPSGNSVAAMNLLRIGRITGNPEFEKKAEGVARAFSGQLGQSPSAFTQMMQALDFMAGPSHEVVIAGNPDGEDTAALLGALREKFLPNKVVLLREKGDGPGIADIAEYTRNQKPVDGKATVYVCRNYACNAPVTEADAMLAALE